MKSCFFSQVYDVVGIIPQKAHLVRWFQTIGFDPIHFGSTQMRFGAIIGVPRHWDYRSGSDIEKEEYRLGHASKRVIPWHLDEGAAIANSLVLSDDAKRFAIARELTGVDNHRIEWSAATVGVLYYSMLAINQRLHRALPLLQKSRAIRYTVFSSTAGLFALSYLWGKDARRAYNDRKNDRRCATLGDSYIVGGYEYYAKAMQRNRALRLLLGEDDGPALYSKDGDHRFGWLRLRWEPLSSRRKFFQQQLSELESKIAEGKQEDNRQAS